MKNNIGYIFIPLYNLSIRNEVYKIYGFKLITSQEYSEKYRHQIYRKSLPFYMEKLDEDVRIPYSGMIREHPLSKYMFVKKIPAFDLSLFDNNDIKQYIAENVNSICNFICAARLYKTGHLQALRYYALSKSYACCGSLPFADSWNEIETIYNPVTCCLDTFDLKKSELKSIRLISKKLENNNNFNLPMMFFSSYYGTCNVYDKLLRLITVLEILLTNDSNAELSYRMSVRASRLLKRDVSKILRLAYDCRSQFIHSGAQNNCVLKKLKTQYPLQNSKDDQNEAELLFQLIKNDLEQIVREVLKRVLNLTDKTKKSFKEIDEDLDEQILSKITESKIPIR